MAVNREAETESPVGSDNSPPQISSTLVDRFSTIEGERSIHEFDSRFKSVEQAIGGIFTARKTAVRLQPYGFETMMTVASMTSSKRSVTSSFTRQQTLTFKAE